MSERRLCRICHERPVVPSRARGRDYRCGRCIYHSPGQQARNARYTKGAKRKAIVKRHNDRRVYVGEWYHSVARTVAEARAINAHIKERRREFVTRLSHREEAESAPARGIPTQAAV